VALFQAQPRGLGLFFRPAALSFAHVAWLHHAHSALLDKKTAPAGPIELVLTGPKTPKFAGNRGAMAESAPLARGLPTGGNHGFSRSRAAFFIACGVCKIAGRVDGYVVIAACATPRSPGTGRAGPGTGLAGELKPDRRGRGESQVHRA